MIERHIKSLLYDYDCVVIPGFGGFITHYVPAEIHPIRHTFLPASKSVAFNEKLKVNDGLLQKAIIQADNVSPEEADRKITEFVFELKKHIKEKNRYTFDEIGTLFINHEYRLQFEPENKVNFNNNSFGLPELYCKPISREPGNRIVAINKDRAAIRKALKKQKAQQKVEDTETSSKRPAALWPLVVFPLITILALGTFFLVRDLEEKNSLSSLNPFALFEDPVIESTE
jgi:nucleoid DNA-binding protein